MTTAHSKPSTPTRTAANAHAADSVLPHFDGDRRRSVGITAVGGEHARRLRGLEDVVGLEHSVEEGREESERRRDGDAIAPLDDGVQRGAGERVDRHIEVRRGVGADFPRYPSSPRVKQTEIGGLDVQRGLEELLILGGERQHETSR